MRKMVILLAGGVGFLLGSRAGRQPYEQFEAQFRRIRRKPQVQEAVQSVEERVAAGKDDLGDRVRAKADEVKSKVASSSSDIGSSEPDWPAAGAAV